jgi:hypothetical protein
MYAPGPIVAVPPALNVKLGVNVPPALVRKTPLIRLEIVVAAPVEMIVKVGVVLEFHAEAALAVAAAAAADTVQDCITN